MKSAPVPEAHVIEHGTMPVHIDRDFGLGLLRHLLYPPVQAIGGARSVDVMLNVGALERQFIRPNVKALHERRQEEANRDQNQKEQRKFSAPRQDQPSRRDRAKNQQPLQRNDQMISDPADPDQVLAMVGKQQRVSIEENLYG